YQAIVRFEEKQFPGQHLGYVDPGGVMLKRMEELAASKPSTPAPAPGSPPKPTGTVFHPGVMHDHRPSGRWADVQRDPKSGDIAAFTCRRFSDPADFLRVVSLRVFLN